MTLYAHAWVIGPDASSNKEVLHNDDWESNLNS